MPKYNIGNIIPHRIDETGQVTFTDGINTGLRATRDVCQSYGYFYDVNSGTCRLNQQFETNLEKEFGKETNKILGTGSYCASGIRNNLVTGFSNKLGSKVRNAFVTGRDNEVTHGVENAIVMGANGKATRQAEFVIGGGLNTGQAYDCGGEAPYSGTLYTDRQFSIINLSGVTCNSSAVQLTVNGDGSSFINVEKNCVIAYEVNLIRMELSGSAATAGDYTYLRGMSAVHIDDSYNMTFSTLTFRNQANEGGNNGSAEMVDTSTTNTKSISLRVSDRVDVVNQWSATVRVYEVISTAITF